MSQLYRVKVQTSSENGFPETSYQLVMADGPHQALDKVSDKCAESDKLYDEDIQRAIINHEIPEHRVNRKYSDYIKQVEYID